jgi:hypothetical protein
MQILSTRFKVSSRRFYESFTSKVQCKSYVRDITFSSSEKFHKEHQGLFLLTSPRTQKCVKPLQQYKLFIDPWLEDKQAH